MKSGSLKYGIGTDKNVISNDDITGKVGSILNDTVISDCDFFCANKTGSIPNRTLQTKLNISNDGGIGSNKISSLKVRVEACMI